MSALRHVFAIVEAVVARQNAGASFAEVVAATGAPKASAHRILKELVELGVLVFARETGRYRGSLRLASIGCEVTANLDLRTVARPHLEALHEATRHTANLGIRDGDAGVYIDKIETPDYGIKLFSEVGKRFPLHCTAMGKVLLAYADEADRERFLARQFARFTPNTIVEPDRLRDELAQVRAAGVGLDREEITRGVVCVAAPVFNGEGVAGAVSVAFPAYVDGDRGIAPEIDAVRRYAAAISGVVGRT